MRIVELGPHRSLILGLVQVMHIRDDLLIDPERFYVDTGKMRVVGRMQGNGYIISDDIFDVARLQP
jgi:hypothetical protein